jgi:hypothetical protein
MTTLPFQIEPFGIPFNISLKKHMSNSARKATRDFLLPIYARLLRLHRLELSGRSIIQTIHKLIPRFWCSSHASAEEDRRHRRLGSRV